MFPLLLIGLMALPVMTAAGAEWFVLEGGDVTLNASEDQPRLVHLQWRVNQTTIVMDYFPHKPPPFNVKLKYEGFIEGFIHFDTNTLSLHLRNLQRNHSGVYTAEKYYERGEYNVSHSYNLIIMEHAAPPTLTLLSAWSSNVTCNVTLRCAVSPDMALNTTCIIDLNSTESEYESESVCSQEGGGRFLSISVNRTTVSCNHSNPVSWRRASVDAASVCSGWGGVSVSLLRAAAISGVIVVMVTAVIAVAICTRRPQTSD